MKPGAPASKQRCAPPPSRALPTAIRRLLRRVWGSLRQLERELCPHFLTAVALSLSPDLAQCSDSTPQDHAVADLLVALRAAAAAIAELDQPIPCDHVTAPIPDDDWAI
jgi:hypothetical protein